MNTKVLFDRVRRSATTGFPGRHPIAGALCLGLLLLYGCHKSPTAGEAKPAAPAKAAGEAKPGSEAKPEADAKTEDDAKADAAEGVTLTAQQAEKMGLAAETVKKSDFAEEITGYGTVIAHETVAQGAAELATAQATQQQSAAALARLRRLSGTPGAMSADVVETNERQAAVDRAALALAQQRLSAMFGQTPPWAAGDKGQVLGGLSNGAIKLLRVTFPLGALTGPPPKSLRAARIGSAQTERGWKVNVVWAAPADATVPGRSFFALLRGSDVGEGERLMVWALVGATEAGVLVPASAAVISEGKYWCYIEKKPGTYIRTEIDTTKRFEGGYFVSEAVAAGDRVVTKGAGQLLARESNTGSGAE